MTRTSEASCNRDVESWPVPAKTLPGLARPGTLRYGSARDEPATFAAVSPAELTQEVRERALVVAERKDVDIVVYCVCGQVWLDGPAFSDAFSALVHNAIRASKRGFPVTIYVRDTADGDVLWQVEDAGVGMSERAVADLGDPPGSKSPDRAGQGVALAWRVIERHGGLLRFESALGVGTTATVWLPGARDAASTPRAPAR